MPVDDVGAQTSHPDRETPEDILDRGSSSEPVRDVLLDVSYGYVSRCFTIHVTRPVIMSKASIMRNAKRGNSRSQAR